MREILFRGKDVESRFWCFGELSHDREGKPHIRFWGHNGYLLREVMPETVGQFIGITDMNNKRIFEGDIVFTESNGMDEEDGNAVIEWDEDTACFVIKWHDLTCDFDNFFGHELEIIGNIYDSPELLEVQ